MRFVVGHHPLRDAYLSSKVTRGITGGRTQLGQALAKTRSSKDPAEYVLNHQKILKVGQSYIGICGPTSLKIVLNDYFSDPELEVSLDSVHAIFRVWKRLHEVLRDDYFLKPDEDDDASFESSRMEVLIANEHGIFGLTAHRAVQEFSRFYAYGNGRDYAMGAMYASFEDESKTAEEIARVGVRAASEFDDSTGLPIFSFALAHLGQ